jgi:AcrR family transcriptional regulator
MGRPKLVTNEQILQTMRAAVLEHGPSVSLDLVAGRLGVTSPALLKRFGSRQTLMIESLKPPEEPPWVKKHHDVDDRPLEVQFESLFTDIWAFLSEALPCVMALRESGIATNLWEKAVGPGPLRGLAALVKWLERAKAAGLIETGDVETAAYTMLGSLHLRTITSHISRQSMASRHHRAHLRSLSSFFANALAPRPKSSNVRRALRTSVASGDHL